LIETPQAYRILARLVGGNTTKEWSHDLAVAALVLAGGVALWELTWLRRSNLAWVFVALGLAVLSLALCARFRRTKHDDSEE
jgi:hypothetical protein